MTRNRFRRAPAGNNEGDGGARDAPRVLQDYRYVGLAGVGLILCAVLTLAALLQPDDRPVATSAPKPQVVVVRVPVKPTSTKPGATHTKSSGHPGLAPAPTATEIIRTAHTVTVTATPKDPDTPKPKSTHSTSKPTPKPKPKPKPTPSPTKSKSCVDALSVASICLGGNQ